MAAGVTGLSHIKGQVQAIRAKFQDRLIIGLHSPGSWDGPSTFRLKQDGKEEIFEVFQSDSVLAIREKLTQVDQNESRLVLLTSLHDAELGQDVTARLAKNRLLAVDNWTILKILFQAHQVDPALGKDRWIADALIETAPPDGYPPVPSGVLDSETAWRFLLRTRLNLQPARPDAMTLLRWTMQRTDVERYSGLPAEFKRGIRAWIGQAAGPVGEAVMNCLDAGHGADAIPIGLVCRVAFHDVATDEVQLKEASVRLEKYHNGRPLEREMALAWAEAAEQVIHRARTEHGEAVVKPWIEQADALLGEVRAQAFACISPVSIVGYRQRLATYGNALTAALKAESAEVTTDVVRAAGQVLAHTQATCEPDRQRRIEMSLRLLRWLCAGKAYQPGSFAEAAVHYAEEGGFVDWARRALMGGESEELAAAYALLKAQVGRARETWNKRFAEMLAEWTATGSSDDQILPIEDTITRVVAPLASESPVLLIVADGMSFAVFRELLSDLSHRGWVELRRPTGDTKGSVIAAIPSVTEASRTSLLCGKLRAGTSEDEVAGFVSHPDLVAQCSQQCPPVLYHKGYLADMRGTDLQPGVSDEIRSPRRRIVAVVVNAVDDHLLKGDQVDPQWTLGYVPVLASLFELARQSRRLVILTSDHGHVIEENTELRKYDERERWREDDGTPGLNELVVQGRRVVLPASGRLIAPWSEQIRYGMKKNGYHGGISPQEMVIPLAVLTSAHTSPNGWSEAASYYPEWWFALAEQAEPVRTPPIAVQPPKRPPSAPELPLFETTTDQEPVLSDTGWINAVLQSEVLASQRQVSGRSAPPPETIRRFLAALDERGGVLTSPALARRLEVPLLRIPGIIAAMRRLFNVEGYQVLTRDEASDSVILNKELLKLQFQLSGEGSR